MQDIYNILLDYMNDNTAFIHGIQSLHTVMQDIHCMYDYV